MSVLVNDEIPQSFPFEKNNHDFMREFNVEKELEKHRMRDEYLARGMYAFVCWDWVDPFVEWIAGRKCLEVMAGNGWLAKALRMKGVDLIATDDNSWRGNKKRNWGDFVSDVEEMDAVAAIKNYVKDVDIVIMSWPYMDDVASDVLTMMNKFNPNAVLVYIGEGDGGCTASSEFFNSFEESDDEKFRPVQRAFIPWPYMHDYIMVGKHKAEDEF